MPSSAFSRMIDLVRLMGWFDVERARMYRLILSIVTLLVVFVMIVSSRHGIDLTGKPLGTDFLAFWSASTLALSGKASAVYDLTQLYAVERGSMPVDPGLSSFLYPPPFLLLCLPLGLAPYFISLTIWLVTTGTAYWLVVRRWLGDHAGAVRGATMTILAYPAVIMNVGHGQNGFLTAALLGGGLWLLDRRPLIAGALLGALIIKPQMAFAIPVLIFASARWRVMLSGSAMALLLCIASWFVFGTGAWNGFLSGSETGRGILEHGLVEPGKLVSVFAAVQILHGGVALGYVVQAAVAVGAAALLARVTWRRDIQRGGDAAVCVCAGALISPFFLDYDLTTTAIPLAWLFSEALRRGFLSWEKAVLVAGYLLPLVTRDLALHLGIPIGPLVLIALLSACARAAIWKAGPVTPDRGSSGYDENLGHHATSVA
ncbi:MAG: hypothetical protein JWL66_305 [Sphingomonadales bacterium]|nr:hypothetical protein [Sphingomonadales bacterium]